MEERTIITAIRSNEYLEESNSKMKQSLWGVLFPLLGPLAIIIYLIAENKSFSDLGVAAYIFFFGGLALSIFLWFCHDQLKKQESARLEKIKGALDAQSLIVTDQRIIGKADGKSFSFNYGEISKAYSTRTTGNEAELAIRLKNGQIIKFQYVLNMQDVITCINDAIAHQPIN